MTGIVGLGALGSARTPGRVRGGAGFKVSEGEEVRVETQAAVAGVSMPSLLAMQEAETGAVQDREARRHGEAMLAALGALQRGLLGGAGRGELERLEGLARALPATCDPRLTAVQRALLVRVAVEVARRRG